MTGATTEAGWLISMVEDLLPIAGNTAVTGDDGEEHGLEVQVGDDGEHRRWFCACTGWDTGWRPPPGRFEVAMAFLHHVYPSRYGARLSIITTETLRSVREQERR